MANIKSQIKRIKTNEKARLRNKAVKSSLKTAIRKAREAAAAGDTEKATEYQRAAARQLDKAVSKGVIHKNQAANKKSALASKVAPSRADTSDLTVRREPEGPSGPSLIRSRSGTPESARGLRSPRGRGLRSLNRRPRLPSALPQGGPAGPVRAGWFSAQNSLFFSMSSTHSSRSVTLSPTIRKTMQPVSSSACPAARP